MDALQFLYWALGAGVIAVVIFLCIALYHVIRILSDVADASDSVKETAETVNETVAEVAEKISDAADQVTTYLVKPVSMVQFFMDKVKPFMNMVQKHTGAPAADDDEEDDEPKKKKRRTFGKKKK